MDNSFSGSCLCNLVKFQIKGNFEQFFLCHCTHCQKDTGSSYAANLFSTSAKLHWISGEESIKTYNLPSTRHMKSFCKECGSALPNLQMEGKLLVVPAGSLNDKVDINPTAHIFYSSKANWENNLEATKKFEKFPS